MDVLAATAARVRPDGWPWGPSPRDELFLRLLVQGKTDKEIARASGYSVHTVGHALKALYRTVGAANRVALAAWAVTHGYGPR